uniref:DNA binding protein n=2 Tax=Thermococcus nautili TaxID=195522 RepID=A6MV73_9EURY|nr:DNA binding protein [Thermococcus nautili]AVP12421.1 p24 [E. coli-T. kodakarensis shuttle vector pTNAg]AVP12426.1 p24 [E. coli-T. kodakarensis shuttle vector pTNTrpE]
MESGENTPYKKFICLHCGHVFDSDRDAPKCPNCGRRKVIPRETLGESLRKHKDKLKELGVLPEPDPEPQETEVGKAEVETAGQKDPETSKPEPIQVEQKVEELKPESDQEPQNSESVDSPDDVPESDKLLAKYLEELEDVPAKPKPKKLRPKKSKRSITVPAGPSFLEVLIIIGAIVLIWKWLSSRSSKSDDESNVPRPSETYYQIQRNLGHHVLG